MQAPPRIVVCLDV